MTTTVINEFLEWWSRPGSNPNFPKRFTRPVQYRRGGGVDDEDALWLIQRSMAHEEVEILSVKADGAKTVAQLLFTDPVTLLRHRARFEIVVDGEQIVSVVEESEIVDKSL